jgi:hypothetical protein
VVHCAIRRLWTLLLARVQTDSPSLQSTICCTARVVATRLYCCYPNLILSLLKLSIDSAELDPRRASLVLDLFSDLGSRVDSVALPRFLDGADLFTYFTINDDRIYDTAPRAIVRLANLGSDWHARLLAEYLQKPPVTAQYRAVHAIVALFPRLLPDVHAAADVTLIAFLWTSLAVPKQTVDFVGKMIDSFPGIVAIGLIDSYLQIFARTEGLRFATDGDVARFEWLGHCCEVPLQRLRARSSLYAFELPMEMLLPEKGDSVLNLTAKFRALSRDPETSYELFEKFLARPHDELTSACLQNLPSCINRIVEIVPNTWFRAFLKKVICGTPASWFHASEILMILKVLERKFFGLIGGLGKILMIVADFLLSPSEPLAKTAGDTILILVDREDAETSWKILFRRIDFLDEVQLSRILPVLSRIIEKVGHLPYFSCF